MEFFHGVNIDWMGKAKYFVALSLILLAVGWISIYKRVVADHGTLYGIDFRGGTLVYVRLPGSRRSIRFERDFSRRVAEQHHPGNQRYLASVGSQNDVVIGLEQKGRATNRWTPESRRFSTFCTRLLALTNPGSRISIQ